MTDSPAESRIASIRRSMRAAALANNTRLALAYARQLTILLRHRSDVHVRMEEAAKGLR